MKNELTKRSDNNVSHLDDHRPNTVYRPPTDIYDLGDKLVIELDMPGVAKDGIDISLEKHVLTIRGKTESRRRDDWRMIYAEYGEGDYERAFTLSEHIDEDKIDAALKNGLLRLELPKAETAKARKISVKAA
ncbi:MAG: Hsp20/alpha crystallin family protein [Hyphomonadaceae bacterium]|nr:Hsp20/alpha crystallin family protein [Hyphomonadaceae bacterium]